jgi:DNA-binding PadR family transcriptional regulator
VTLIDRVLAVVDESVELSGIDIVQILEAERYDDDPPVNPQSVRQTLRRLAREGLVRAWRSPKASATSRTVYLLAGVQDGAL